MDQVNQYRYSCADKIRVEVNKLRGVQDEKDVKLQALKKKEFEAKGEKIIQVGSDMVDSLENLCDNDAHPSIKATVDKLSEHLAKMEKAEQALDKFIENETNTAKSSGNPSASALILDLQKLSDKGKSDKIVKGLKVIRERVETA